nr:MAG TPA: protein of unknown function (DUF5320) [Caudoviricetes sp.]
MIYINDNWESVSTLDKCLNLVEEYNKELAAKIVELLPVHTDEEYYELERELKKSDDYLRDAEDEVDRLQEQVDDLNEEISDLEHLLKEGEVTKDKIILTTNESGDWAILEYKDFKLEGHQIKEYDWIDLLEYLGYKIEDKEISDEEMEELC